MLLLFTAFLWFVRDRTLIYGDGMALVSGLVTAGPLPALEPLSELLHRLAYEGLRSLPPFATQQPFLTATLSAALMSVSSGSLAAVALWHIGANSTPIAGDGSPITPPAVFIPAVVLAQGHIAIFAGHAENYSLAAAVMLLYVALAARSIRRQGLVVAAGATLAFACLLHLMALVLLPSWLALIRVSRPRSIEWFGSLQAVSLTIMPVLIVFVGYLALAAAPLGFVGVGAAGAVRAIGIDALIVAGTPRLLAAHCVALANGLILIGPWSVVLGLVAIGTEALHPRARGRETYFHVALILPSVLLIMILGESNLGYARNWDVLAPLSLVIAASGSALFSRHVGATSLRRLSAVIVGASLLHTLPWLLLNADEAASLRRFANLPLQPGQAASTVGLWHALQGRLEEAELWWERGLRQDPTSVRLLLFRGHLEVDRHDYMRAATYYARADSLRPELVAPLAGEAQALVLAGKRDSALRLIEHRCRLAQDSQAAREICSMLVRAKSVKPRTSHQDTVLVKGLERLARGVR